MASAPAWTVPTNWTDALPATVTAEPDESLTIKFGSPEIKSVTRRSKAVALAELNSTLLNDQVIVLDVESDMSGGCRLALAFSVGDSGTYVESAPAYVRPGKNSAIVFDLRANSFKSEASGWKYEVGLDRTTAITNWHFIIYPQSPSGTISIRNLRAVQPQARQ